MGDPVISMLAGACFVAGLLTYCSFLINSAAKQVEKNSKAQLETNEQLLIELERLRRIYMRKGR